MTGGKKARCPHLGSLPCNTRWALAWPTTVDLGFSHSRARRLTSSPTIPAFSDHLRLSESRAPHLRLRLGSPDASLPRLPACERNTGSARHRRIEATSDVYHTLGSSLAPRLRVRETKKRRWGEGRRDEGRVVVTRPGPRLACRSPRTSVDPLSHPLRRPRRAAFLCPACLTSASI